MLPAKTRFRGVLGLGAMTALLLALVLAGCYPGGPQDLGDTGLAITFKSPTADYSGLHTYAMPDTVLALINEGDDSSEPLDRRWDEDILTEIAANLESRGFVRILDPDETNVPDVVVQVGAVQSDAYLIFSYWGYPGYGWGYPGWGWGYPGYPSTGAYKYKQGSITWTMLDIRELDPASPDPDDATVIWVAGLNGALSGTGSNPESGIPNGIGQCFDQSTYIQAENAGN